MWFACAKYRTWIYHKLFCQMIFHCPKQTTSWPKQWTVTRFWWTISSTIYIYMFCANLIYFISITCRVYFPTSLRVVHLEVRNFVLRQVTKHATWRQGKANGTECWWKQKSNTGWFDDLWLRIWNAQGFLKDLFNIFLLGQERWWKEKPTLGLRMINGGST